MHLIVAQLNPTVGDVKGNADKIIAAITEARRQYADCILFSELVLTGYPPQDFLLMPQFIDEVERQLVRIIAESSGITVILGLPSRAPVTAEKPLHNSAAVITDRVLIGFQHKCLLPTYDVFDEMRYFEPGKSNKIWMIGGKKVGITICEDMWQHSDKVEWTSYHRDPIGELRPLKPELLLNLSASPYSIYKPYRRLDVCAAAASTLRCPAILCNQVGGNDSLIFDGYSCYVDANGKLKQCAKGFQEELLAIDLYNTSMSEQPAPIAHKETITDLYRALVMGVRDYFHKSGFSRACLGLSGGIDSALVACIAVDALGKEHVLGVSMPSRYTAKESIQDAHQLALTLGIEWKEISIENPFSAYLELLTPHFEGKAPDTTEENLQARIRGMILMSLSNKHGYIVLSTGNKSEVAMGYATLYGDMCGGLSVISDLTKGQVYALARWVNRKREIIPENTIKRPPTAELRPNQKDSDTLPDYEIIDTVVEEYLENHHTAEMITAKHGYDLSLVESLIKKIHQNEYKRKQMPPGLRISEKAFSVGRSYPIVQGWVKSI